MSPRFMDWVDEFSPDVVYTQLASIKLIRLVRSLLDRRSLPLVIHIMDDWPSVIYREGPLGRLLNRRTSREFGELVKRTDRLMAISQTMAEEYSSRYRREVTYSHNPVDLAAWNGSSKTDWSTGRVFKFVYAGRVGRANARSLGDLAACVEALAKKGRSVLLDVYTQDATSDLSRSLARRCVVVHQAVPYQAVPRLLAAADALVLPLDADREGFAFSRLSMPTKTAEYMACGAPIVVYAPRRSALAEYAARSKWALLVDDGCPISLVRALELLMDDGDYRCRLGVSAKKVARENHDAVCVRERFREMLRIGCGSDAGA
jgi:glycosyltransferase involved in cell wall biosynthesis